VLIVCTRVTAATFPVGTIGIRRTVATEEAARAEYTLAIAADVIHIITIIARSINAGSDRMKQGHDQHKYQNTSS